MNWIEKTFRNFRHLFAPQGKSPGRNPGDRTARAAPEPGEAAWATGLFFGAVPLERWNPDLLVGRQGYDVYRRMLHDDQVRALIALKQAVIASRGWSFQVPGTHRKQPVCAEFFRFLLERHLQGSFTQVLTGLMSSQAFGFSLVEKVYEPVRWRRRTLWAVRALKLRPAETFTFAMDAHGNPRGLYQEQGGRRVRLASERFIHHVNKPEVHPLYGESDLREVHRHWWAKENVLKFWNIYLERMASGFVHGRIAGPMNAGEREELKQVMRTIGSRTAVITPDNVELQLVTAPSTDAFERAVAARDKAIAKALLVPGLLGFSEQGRVGSYSQSRTQQETFFLVMNGLAESIADTLNEQLFRELAWWNFGLREAPRFVFDPLTEQQKREHARAWREALQGGAVRQGDADEARMRELLGFPPPPAREPGRAAS